MIPQYDIMAVGECLIDFVCTSGSGNLYMEGNPGGAPLNVLAMASKLGLSAAMVSKVGNDRFGEYLLGHIRAANVDCSYMLQSAAPTTLAIVQLDGTGNRSFTFYRDRTADVMLRADELPLEAVRRARILHFGSVSLTCEPARSATLEAVRQAKEAGTCISFDPNLRPPLWENLKEAHQAILAGLELADLVKVSDEELQFVTDEPDVGRAMEQLFRAYPMQLLMVTMGPKGCICRTGKGRYDSYAFDTPCVDTTGAGDAFWGAALSWIFKNGRPDEYSDEQMKKLLDFANAAGSLATVRKGALPAMPDEEQIEECIAKVPHLVN